MPAPLDLTRALERNERSQFGEDGIIAAIMDAMNVRRGAAVEFGAWDGNTLSNTAELREAGWDVCLIEGDRDRHRKLAESFRDAPNVTAVHRWVASEGEDSIDRILEQHFDRPVDLMSIDIDGDDYHVLRGMTRQPSVVVIEFNPTIPSMIDRINPPGRSKGSSLLAITRLGMEKGYRLVYATLGNAFLVYERHADLFVTKTPMEAYRWDQASFVCSDFDGGNWIANGDGPIEAIVNPWTKARSRARFGWHGKGVERAVRYLFRQRLGFRKR